MPRRFQVVVIGNNIASEDDKLLAYEVGKLIGKSGAVLISGGKRGVMKYASKGAQEEGGLVIGIIPDSSFDGANPFCDIVIPSGIGYARNLMNILSGDLIIAIGGGAGTLSELAYAWQFEKNIMAFNSVIGWSSILAEKERVDTKHNKKIISLSSLDDFKSKFTAFYNSWKNQNPN